MFINNEINGLIEDYTKASSVEKSMRDLLNEEVKKKKLAEEQVFKKIGLFVNDRVQTSRGAGVIHKLFLTGSKRISLKASVKLDNHSWPENFNISDIKKQ